MGHVLDFAAKNLHYGLDAAALLSGNPEFIPAIEGVNSGAQTYAKTGNIGSSLKSGAIHGALSYAGGAIGGSVFPTTVAEALPGNAFGSFVANTLPSSIGGAALGAIGGGYAGNSIADAISPSGVKGRQAVAAASAGQPTPFSPKQDNAAATPSSLQALGGLTPLQQATNVATGGVYGGQNGPDEKSYFTNLINRQLIDSGGKVSNISTLNPIENSYLKQIGLGGYGNSSDLLQAISKFKPS